MLPDFRVRQRDYLLEIARALSEELDIDELLAKILRIAIEMLAGKAGLILLKESNSWHIGKKQGITPDFLSHLESLLAEKAVMEMDVEELIPILKNSVSSISANQLNGVGLPLNSQKKDIGIIFIFRNYPDLFTDNDKTLLRIFADQAAVALFNARHFSQVIGNKEQHAGDVNILYISVFISYSSKDEAFAQKLHNDLQDNGVHCWFAPNDIQGGKKIHEQIYEAIQTNDRLLLILSENSMSSQWVMTEIAKAREKEIQQKRQVLFPIRLVKYEKIKAWESFDAATGKDSAREIREYYIPDFSNWVDEKSYQTAFGRLLKDLRAPRKT